MQISNKIEAIKLTYGPLLIIAGPGTGKTFTLVKRIVYLITEKGVQPEEIMVATFTEKAAKELITRITNELYNIGVQVNINDMYVGTFHSICLRIIKEHLEYTRVKKNYRMMDQFDQSYMIFQHINEFRALLAIVNLPPRSMMGIDSCGMLLSAIHNVNGEEKLNLVMLDDSIPAGAKLY